MLQNLNLLVIDFDFACILHFVLPLFMLIKHSTWKTLQHWLHKCCVPHVYEIIYSNIYYLFTMFGNLKENCKLKVIFVSLRMIIIMQYFNVKNKSNPCCKFPKFHTFQQSLIKTVLSPGPITPAVMETKICYRIWIF